MKTIYLATLLAAGILATSACDSKNPNDPKPKVVDTAAAKEQGKQAYQDTKAAVKEAAAATGGALQAAADDVSKEIAEAKPKWEARIEELRRDIAVQKEKIKDATADDRAAIERKIANMDGERTTLETKLDRLKREGAQAWKELKADAKDVAHETKEAIKDNKTGT